MTTPAPGPWPTQPYISESGNESFWPTIFPPPIQGLAVAYLTPLLAPTPVATRLPVPSNTADTVNGFLRIEAGGGVIGRDELLFNCSVILHAYTPNNQESLCEILCGRAVAFGGAAQGKELTHPSLNYPWYVTYSRINALPTKQADPLVNLTRFRAMVSWRIQGMPDPQR